jgi:PAS domain S-box-containing protein
VEHVPADLRDVEAALSPLGYRLVKGSSGDEVRELLSRTEWSCIVADVQAPGLEVLATLLPHVPLLLLSPTARDEAALLRGLSFGGVEYVLKPFAPDALRARVAALMERFQNACSREERFHAHEAEVLWKSAREQLYSVLQEAPALISIYSGPEHVLEFVNTAAERASLGARAVLGRPARQALPELEGQGYFELLDRVYQTGEPGVIPESTLWLLAERARAEIRSFHLVFQPLRGLDGRVEGVACIAFEVTELVRARQRAEALADDLRRSEERFRTFAEATSIILWSADHAGNIVEDSPSWREFTGQTYEQWRGYGWLDAIHPEDRDRTALTWQRAYSSRTLYEVEYRLGRKEGGYSHVLARGVPLFYPDGSLREWSGTVADITERKLASEERERLLGELAGAVRARDEFLSVASHELKTPLTPLNLKLQVLARAAGTKSVTPERLLADIEVMRRQVKRLADLVNDLLDVSRISTGRLVLNLEQVDLSAVVREVAAQFEPQAVKAGCRLELQVEERVVGHWDRLRLEQVVVNLLSNAIKYGAGGPVQVRVETDDERARLLVRDEGIGIEPEHLERIFGKFERAVSERHYGGLGLGLYITKQVVEVMGGTVSAESRPGQGASFHVELPLRGPAAETHP